MYKVSKLTINNAHKPFDVVSISNGSVGIIREVSVNVCQPEPHQISYSVMWLVGDEIKAAWWNHSELTVHKNLFVVLAECACHPFGNNREWVKVLMGRKKDE